MIAPFLATWYALLGGIFTIRLDDPNAKIGQRFAQVFDPSGLLIGIAEDHSTKGSGWIIHTRTFEGYVDHEQVEIVQ